MRTRFDEFGKQVVGAAIEAGGKAELEHRVVGPSLRVDIWFQPDPQRMTVLAQAGLLGRIAAMGPCLIESYRNTPALLAMQSCLCRQQILQHASVREALRTRKEERARGDRPASASRLVDALPRTRLWLLSPGRPRTILQTYGFIPMPGWPRGCYAAPRDIDARHVVVARELPATRDTLLVRLLGRGKTFEHALKELEALPADAWEKKLAVPLLVAYAIDLPQNVDQDMPNSLQRSRAIYNQWEANVKRQAHEEGREDGLKIGREDGLKIGREDGERAVVLRLLAKRFGPLPAAVVARVERAGLADLDRFAERLLTAASLDAVFTEE